MSPPGLGPGPREGSPPFPGSCFELDNPEYQSLRKKLVTVIRTQFPAVCPGSGAGEGALSGLLEPLWPFAGDGPSSQNEEAGTGRGA